MALKQRIEVAMRRRVRHLIRAHLIAGRFRSTTYRYRQASTDDAIVIICLWNRPSRMRPILELLDVQDFRPGIQLYLWNNNRLDHELYVSALTEYSSTGALTEVSLVKSPLNLGSIARFYWARKLSATRPGAPVIIIDDDEDFDFNFVSTAYAQYEPSQIKAWWAWRWVTSHLDRQPAAVGESVDHIGPGGSVMSISIFRDARFFTEIPDKFRMLDDVWLSYFAKQHGIALAKLPVQMQFVMDETNQYHGQMQLKSEFFDHLYPENGRSG